MKLTTILLGAAVVALPIALFAAEPKLTMVTGFDAVTAAAQQSETAYNVSQLGGGTRVETISYNDKSGEAPAFLVYTANNRTISLGTSLMGWSFRTRTLANPDPTWTHAKVRPPAGTGALWGDPSIFSHPELPNVVLIGSLSMPANKFPANGKLEGEFPGTCNAFGGGCVARSTDGGMSFTVVNCFVDSRDTGQPCLAPFEKTKGHFYDGTAVAITKTTTGATTTFSGYAAFVDTDTAHEALWKMADVTGATPAQQFVIEPDRMGTIGNMGVPDNGETGEIDTHVRLQSDGPDLWKMSRENGDLKVNIHGKNRPFKVIASNAHTPFSVKFADDAFGQVFVRTGPQFAFDIGLNELGQKEMRFAYVADEGGLSFIQAGFCTMDLSDCQRPVQWRLPAFGTPFEFHPALEFAAIPGSSQGIWRMTYWGTTAMGASMFYSDLVRSDLVPTTTTNSTATGLVVNNAVSTEFVPCSTTGEDGYWGDYDGMAFDSTSLSFSRAFTDSSSGCNTRNALNALNLHVSSVEIPLATKVTFKGTVDTTDHENVGENETSLVQVDDSCSVDAAHPVDDHFSIHPCTGDEVVIILKVKCTLTASGAVTVDVHSELLEGDGCGTDQENEDTEDVSHTLSFGVDDPQVAIDLTHECFNCGDHAEIRLKLANEGLH